MSQRQEQKKILEKESSEIARAVSSTSAFENVSGKLETFMNYLQIIISVSFFWSLIFANK